MSVAPITPMTQSRRLLSRLRDVMAGSGSAQARLDKIVRLIAAEMVAEVCSCYVVRPGEVLELFATVGLNPEAVHQTRLRVGEGLVGDVAATARSAAIANAARHPKFAYRPETGEDPFHSFLGVPLIRDGKVRGVLVIQNRRPRVYADEEVEMLQTVAMVVSELVAGGELGDKGEVAASEAGGTLPARIEGMPLNDGLARGLAVLHRPQLTVREMVADEPVREVQRLGTALAAMHRSLDRLVEITEDSGIGEGLDILETYRMFAEDRGWVRRIEEAIQSGLTAEAAVQRVRNDTAARMARITDPYLRERMTDFDDLATRLLLNLSGKGSQAAVGTLPDDVVLVARTIGPAELLDYEQKRLRAVVVEEGSATSHVAIVARALGIPVVGRCADALNIIDPLDVVLVDGDNGQVFVRPSEDAFGAFEQSLAVRAERAQSHAELVGRPAVSRDGVRISLNLNAGLLIDLPHLVSAGADGIGLYRTEIPFMVRSAYPDVAAQTDLYRRIFEQAQGRPVTFRTLDVGGDKSLPYFAAETEQNPALGWRAIRMGLDRPAMLLKQLRALIRAAEGRPLRIMFPMVAQASEFDAVSRLMDRELTRALQQGYVAPSDLQIGAMVEVPAIFWQLDALLSRADFLAVGTNDLLQYMFAADRGDPKLANRYDTLSPAFLNILGDLAAKAERAGKPISVCGEMAGRPLEAMALIGLGFRSLSMAATSVGPVKAMILGVDVDPLADFVGSLRRRDSASVRTDLHAYARDHGLIT
ncbi:MAG: phosphoenolpyruvate--protein phosphotransferase [Pseudomonadota bacterium]